MQIKTNNQPRDLITYDELTEKQQAELGEMELEQVERWKGFVFKGNAYCLDEFTILSDGSEVKNLGWDAAMSTSYFHAIIVKLDMQNLDRVIVGQVFN